MVRVSFEAESDAPRLLAGARTGQGEAEQCLAALRLADFSQVRVDEGGVWMVGASGEVAGVPGGSTQG